MKPSQEPGIAGGSFAPDTALAGYLVSRDPLIVWGPNQPGRSAGPGTVLAAFVGNRRAYFLFSMSSTRETDPAVEADVAEIQRLRADYPEHRHIALCNTRAEVDRFAARGVPAILCSALAYVDETRFVIGPTAVREFDAIYNASLTPVKRHQLCREVPNLALIYHWFAQGRGGPVPEILAEYRALLPQATFVNDLDGAYRRLDNDAVCRWINRSRVGLCLSAREGAMLVTMEYLLCGIPVVSTPNLGGRDRVLDPRHSIVVEPDPAAVAEAVRTLSVRAIPPREIRDAAMAAMRDDRRRLLALIETIHREEGVRFPAGAAWIQLFRRTAWPMTSVAGLLGSVPIAAIRPGGGTAGGA